jgi:hypothetical protein
MGLLEKTARVGSPCHTCIRDCGPQTRQARLCKEESEGSKAKAGISGA